MTIEARDVSIVPFSNTALQKDSGQNDRFARNMVVFGHI
jgi:hypothetical protein